MPIFNYSSILEGDGLHWEQGGRADEVEVLPAFSKFLDILTKKNNI